MLYIDAHEGAWAPDPDAGAVATVAPANWQEGDAVTATLVVRDAVRDGWNVFTVDAAGVYGISALAGDARVYRFVFLSDLGVKRHLDREYTGAMTVEQIKRETAGAVEGRSGLPVAVVEVVFP